MGDGMFSTLNFWRSLGKRKWMNGPADLNLNFQNGLEKDLARKLEIQSLLTTVMKARKLLEAQVLMKRKKKRKRRRRKNKSIIRNTGCPHKKWDLLLVIVAVNPTFFGTPCSKCKCHNECQNHTNKFKPHLKKKK